MNYRSSSKDHEPEPETTSTITGFPGQTYFTATNSESGGTIQRKGCGRPSDTVAATSRKMQCIC